MERTELTSIGTVKRSVGRPKTTVKKIKLSLVLNKELVSRVDKIISLSGQSRMSFIASAIADKVIELEKISYK